MKSQLAMPFVMIAAGLVLLFVWVGQRSAGEESPSEVAIAEAAADPVVPETVSEPEPSSERSSPDPAVADDREPAVETTAEGEPAPEPIPEPPAQPVSAPAVEPTPEPAPEPIEQPMAAPVLEPEVEAEPEPASEPAPEPVAEPFREPEPVPELAVREEAPPPVGETGPSALELVQTVKNWVGAWSEQRVDDYLDFYARSFTPEDGVGRARWAGERRERIAGPRFVRVTITGLETRMLDDGSARATFLQYYRSDGFSDTVRKTLELVREDGRWRIQREYAVTTP